MPFLLSWSFCDLASFQSTGEMVRLCGCSLF